MLLTILAFVFVFLIITLVHEGAHLYFSKKAGIRVHEFGIGFGPTIFSFDHDYTTYKINALPILGYVKIAGLDTEDPKENDTPENSKYYNKGIGSKFLAISMGAIFNLIAGFVLFSILFMFTGIPSGITNEISAISPGSPAVKAGLKQGDKIISVDGKSYETPEEAVKYVHNNADKELTLKIDRQGEKLLLKATPKYNKRLKVALIGFSLKPTYDKVSPLMAIYYGFKQTVGLITVILVLLGKLLIGRVSLGDLAGPVGIAQITGQHAHGGLGSFVSFLAFFNINVGLLNLLPIPALDGGRLFFLLIEAIRRKPFDIEKENKIHAVGLTILLGLMAILTFNDILRIFRQ